MNLNKFSSSKRLVGKYEQQCVILKAPLVQGSASYNPRREFMSPTIPTVWRRYLIFQTLTNDWVADLELTGL